MNTNEPMQNTKHTYKRYTENKSFLNKSSMKYDVLSY